MLITQRKEMIRQQLCVMAHEGGYAAAAVEDIQIDKIAPDTKSIGNNLGFRLWVDPALSFHRDAPAIIAHFTAALKTALPTTALVQSFEVNSAHLADAFQRMALNGAHHPSESPAPIITAEDRQVQAMRAEAAVCSL